MPRTEVRFRRPGREERWRYGKLATWVETMLSSMPESIGPESAIDIYDPKTGGVCVVLRKFVERKERGPRGGAKWVAL